MPIYVYGCDECDHTDDEYQSIRDEPHTECPICKSNTYHRIPTLSGTTMREYRNPIKMQSIGLNDPNDIRDFQVRNPGVEIETDPAHPDYGVPVATSLHQKNSILKNEKFVDRNSY